jgi:hypothetical protein
MPEPGSNINVLEEPAVTCGGATLFDFGAEPLVMVHRAGWQIERHLVDRAASFRRQARQFCFEFGRNLQVHETSVGCLDIAVNRRLAPLGWQPAPERAIHKSRRA